MSMSGAELELVAAVKDALRDTPSDVEDVVDEDEPSELLAEDAPAPFEDVEASEGDTALVGLFGVAELRIGSSAAALFTSK
jgi:hypothetical protein